MLLKRYLECLAGWAPALSAGDTAPGTIRFPIYWNRSISPHFFCRYCSGEIPVTRLNTFVK